MEEPVKEEILIYDRALTPEETKEVRRYLSAKWGDSSMTHNIFDEPEKKPATEYIDLYTIVDFVGFKHAANYREQEKELLEPQLTALGFTDVEWMPGETDSFGPLTRVCRARNRFDEIVWFVYG